ncbi:MAG: NfeD family protein [Geminicoccaceae bacterium]|nr:NfeD family protein [Geminicoccaceae bacterium]
MIPTFWHWLTLGGLLIIIEVFAPGFVFIWLGVAALLVGGITWLADGMSWQWQFVLFGALGLASILVWLGLRTKTEKPSDQPDLNRRGAQYVGKVFDLVDGIENGRGRIRIGDGTWVVTGPDCPAGHKVRVVAVDGAVLAVEPFERN